MKSRLILSLAVILLMVTTVLLLISSNLTIYVAIASLVLFIIESYRDKTEKRKGAIDFISLVLVLIILYKFFI
jgi:hypothetical protein